MRPETVPETRNPLHARRRQSFERILVVVDAGARVHPCVDKAARIAQGCGATLDLYVCDTLRDEEMAERSAREERALALLEQLASSLRARGLTVECHTDWHAPLEQGVGLRVLRSNTDLVVKDTHPHNLASMQGGYGLTDWTLIRQIPVPLLLVRPQPWPERPKIAVGVDPLHPAQRPEALDESLIAVSQEFANALRGTIDALHVLQEPPHLPGEAVAAESRQAAHAHAREEVTRLVVRRDSTLNPIALNFKQGAVASSVLGFAAEYGTNILVMGSGAHSRWRQSGASGTAAQILESLPCDLLVVRPPGYVSPLLVTEE
jgi:universal stress protein E